MCRKVICSFCGKFTWTGCGLHISTALKDVSENERCDGWNNGTCSKSKLFCEPISCASTSVPRNESRSSSSTECIELIGPLLGHTEDRVWHVSWSEDGKYLASSGEDKIVRIWSNEASPGDWDNISNISCISTLEDIQGRTIRSCEWSGNNCIATASFDGTVYVWESISKDNRKWEQVACLEGHENEVKSISWSPDGSLLATCGRDKRVWVWERVASDFECVAMLDGHTQDVKFVKFHPTLPLLFSASYDDTVRVWQEEEGDWFCAKTLTGHTSTVWGLSFDSISPRLRFASCSDDCSVLVFEGAGDGGGAWRVAERLPSLHEDPIYSIDWSSDHGYLATASGDNSIAILQPSTGGEGSDSSELIHEVGRKAQAHSNDVNCVRWNPSSSSSQILATAGDDGLVRLWRFTPN